MSVIKLQATADADGRLRLDLPARPGWTYNVQLVLTVTPPFPPDATPDERGEWPRDFLENVLGSIDSENDGFDELMREYGHPGDAAPADGR
ncbi:MAG: hypothetical protein K2X82_06190 [Gemmataceae bacterium]|nr:hypothetical protein [Gemmataceae bacterium]